MNQPRTIAVLAVLLLLVAVAPWAQRIEPSPELFDRDTDAALNPELELVEDTDDWTLYHLLFDGAGGERVPALLGLPKVGEAPYPVIMVQHGLGGNKDVDYAREPARKLSQAGYATLRIDARMHGERSVPTPAQDIRQAVIAMVLQGGWQYSIVDMRRGLDYLATRDDIDMERIGYMGMSMGAIMGGVLCGVDDRIDAGVLLLGGSFKPIIPDLLDHIDPANYIAAMAPRPLLMLNGKQDPIVPPAAAQGLYDAAQDPKRIVWYETEHTVPIEEALVEVTTFLGEHVPLAAPEPAEAP